MESYHNCNVLFSLSATKELQSRQNQLDTISCKKSVLQVELKDKLQASKKDLDNAHSKLDTMSREKDALMANLEVKLASLKAHSLVDNDEIQLMNDNINNL